MVFLITTPSLVMRFKGVLRTYNLAFSIHSKVSSSPFSSAKILVFDGSHDYSTSASTRNVQQMQRLKPTGHSHATCRLCRCRVPRGHGNNFATAEYPLLRTGP
ncbi:hypothetical protein N7541_006797 [Penicillium brevicompactum]|uniref:Uncharacterized protein n=1 Tax=Penicillium brevicompactum TaxID=5074 RepID=A0A9W9UQX7_PENBR|nr:hypothetical protein N7541_006797 [Penicillium brevicompactum]